MRPERLLPVILVIVGAVVFFSAYHKKTKPIPVPAELAGVPGPRLFFEHDCATCHTVTSLPQARGTLGPGLDDVGHRAQTLDPASGGYVYLKESLLDPGKVVRDGFVNAMPSYAGRLNEQELSEMVSWLATLKIDSTPTPLAAPTP